MLCACLLAACSGMLPSAAPLPTETPPSPTETFTPTIVWFPPTNTPTLLVTSTRQPTPETRPAVGELLLEDDFSQANNWQTSRTTAGAITVTNGRITLAVQREYGILQSLRNAALFSDFYAEIDINLNLCSPQDQAGFIFRADDAGNYYRVLLRCDGYLRVERVADYKFSILQNWTTGSGFVSGALQQVRLGVWTAGSEMRFFVNDTYQFSTRDPAWSSGQVGVYARAGSADPVSLSFSSLSIHAVDKGAVPPTPTLTPAPTR